MRDINWSAGLDGFFFFFLKRSEDQFYVGFLRIFKGICKAQTLFFLKERTDPFSKALQRAS